MAVPHVDGTAVFFHEVIGVGSIREGFAICGFVIAIINGTAGHDNTAVFFRISGFLHDDLSLNGATCDGHLGEPQLSTV